MNYFDILFQAKTGKIVPYSKTYFDTLFAAKIADLQIKTLTGTLPLTFRTSETALRSWTIYGNNAPHNYSATGTLPLTFTAKAGNAVDWVIYGNDDNGTENMFDAQKIVTDSNNASTYIDGEWLRFGTGASSMKILVDATKTGAYTLQVDLKNGSTSSNAVKFIYTYADSTTENSEQIILRDTDEHRFTITSDSAKKLVKMETVNTSSLPAYIKIATAMLTAGSTAPDHYIPYQQGVGERTGNLFDCRKNNNGYTDITVAGVRFLYGNQSITLSQTATGRYPQQQIKGENGILTLIKNTQYYGRLYIDNAPENANIYMLLHASTDGSRYTTIATIISDGVTFTPSDDYTAYRWLFVAEGDGITYNNTVVRFAIVESSTAPASYTPYGYQIPLTISQTGQPDKTVDIYIGDSPLTEGETVSKQSTGVDIELFEGENTVSTTLYNKPETAITYTDYLGVGEYVDGQWQIPLTISSGNQSTDYTIPIDAPLTEGQSVSDTVEITAYEGANTLDTTLTVKPDATITYK